MTYPFKSWTERKPKHRTTQFE